MKDFVALFVLKKCCLVELVSLFTRCFATVSERCRQESWENNQESIAKIQVVEVQESSNKKKLCVCRPNRVQDLKWQEWSEVVVELCQNWWHSCQ